VRRPFLYSGLVFGFLGGATALVLLLALSELLGAPVARLAALYGGGFSLAGPTVLEALALIGGATALGWFGAWVGAARLIAGIEPKS
jgi:cell division transport system permease protein